jgi:glycosyltransferase involved in cell wall biosynthesis
VSEVGLSIVVMAFDEAASLEEVVGELEAAAKPLEHPYQILIVDDGSGDGTGEIADRLAEERAAVGVIHHPSNQGLGEV